MFSIGISRPPSDLICHHRVNRRHTYLIRQRASIPVQHGSHATMILDSRSAIQLCIDPSDLMRDVIRVSGTGPTRLLT